MSSTNEQKNPMEFFNDNTAAKMNKNMDDLMKALKFGVPSFGDKLIEAYNRRGLDGLRSLEKCLDNYVIIKSLVNGEIDININITDDDENPVPFNKNEWNGENWEDNK